MRELLLVAYIISEFLLYILTYKIILCANLNKDRSRWISAVIGLIIFHGFIWLRYGEAMTKNLTIFSMVLIPILLLDKLLKVQNLILYSVLVYYLYCVYD